VNDEPGKSNPTQESSFSREVGAQATRKLKALRSGTKSIWFGLGMSGLVGWSVTIPTLLGAGLGIWVDNHYRSRFSWTLMLLLAGLIIGCLNASYWVASEYKDMQEDPND
jgi:ATP synthase protein I